MQGQIVAGIYVRISKVKGETLGTERQVPPCREFCEQHGWRVHDVYVDNGVSAYRAKHRKNFERLLADVRNGTINAMVSWQPDRLLRTVPDASAIIDMAKSYGAVVANVGGTIDLATAAGRKKFYNLANHAEYESALRSERLKLKHDELGQAGRWGGGNRPFGYDLEDYLVGREVHCRLVVNRGEAGEIESAVEGIIELGGTISGVAAGWNRRGVTRAGGGKWGSRDVRRLLTNPRIAGFRAWHGELVDAEWEPIIDLDTFNHLQIALAARPLSPRRGRGPLPRAYLLSGGLGVCGNPGCGKPLRPHRTSRANGGVRCYRCDSRAGGCGRLGRYADPVENAVRDAVLTAFDSPELGPLLRAQLQAQTRGDGHVRALLNERETLRAKLSRLEEDYFDDLLDRDQFARGQARVKERLAEVEAGLVAATPVRLPVKVSEGKEALWAAWEEWSIEERRAVVAFALKRVVVKPMGRGYRFNPVRDLELDWRV
jgi:DNA invertase Pin-like site-specific DNA recombinase